MTKMTKADILALATEERALHFNDPRRSAMLHTLASEETAIFKCSCCECVVPYLDLEAWICDFDNDDYTCSICYEEEMGDDL